MTCCFPFLFWEEQDARLLPGRYQHMRVRWKKKPHTNTHIACVNYWDCLCVCETGVKIVFKPRRQLQKLGGGDLLTGSHFLAARTWQQPSFLHLFLSQLSTHHYWVLQLLRGRGSETGTGETLNWERKIGAGIRVMKFETAAYRGFGNIAVCLTGVFVGQSRWIVAKLRCRAK